jgi:hypothetical protein
VCLQLRLTRAQLSLFNVLLQQLRMTFKETAITSLGAEITELIDYQGFCGFSAAAPATAAATTSSNKQQSSSSSSSGVVNGAAVNGAAINGAAVNGAHSSRSSSSSLLQPQQKQQQQQQLQQQGYAKISAVAAAERLQSGWSPFVLDVRLPQEADIASLPFADLVCPHRAVATVADQLPRVSDFCTAHAAL